EPRCQWPGGSKPRSPAGHRLRPSRPASAFRLSRPTRNEWGESWREGLATWVFEYTPTLSEPQLEKNKCHLSPALSPRGGEGDELARRVVQEFIARDFISGRGLG